jgi:hypothetical protein
VTFRFIEEHRGQWPVRLLCETLEVSTAGYYAWRERPASVRAQRRDALVVEIRAIHAEVKARYGSPRIHAELTARGQPCCVNTVARLMQECGIAAKTTKKFRCTTDSNHDLPVADNLLDRQFDPTNPNDAWVADITYIPTREGWLYLAPSRTCTRGGSSAGRWPTTCKAVSWSMPWSWRCSADCREKGFFGRTPTEAASTPANTTNFFWRSMGSPAV